MKAVMYHYVRPETERPPDYYYLDVNDFRRQLDHFEDQYGFVSRDEFLACVRGDAETVPSGVVLTFDDGLRDHYEVVYPELQKRGLWGIFYVPTGPYRSGRLLDVHRTHVLLGGVRGSRLLSAIRDVIDESMIPHKQREEFRTESYRDHDDAEATKQVKRILNYYVDDSYQHSVLDRVCKLVDHDPIDPITYYVQPEEFREMDEDGMIIGAHTVNHPVLSKLDRREQSKEIVDSFAFLQENVGNLEERTFCYPYGKKYTYTDETISILEETNCEWTFAVEPRDIEREDIDCSIQTLPRYDCNAFPHGEASGSI